MISKSVFRCIRTDAVSEPKTSISKLTMNDMEMQVISLEEKLVCLQNHKASDQTGRDMWALTCT